MGMGVRDGHLTTVQGEICPYPCSTGLKILFCWYSKVWSGTYYRFKDSQEAADAQSSKSSLVISKHQTKAEKIEKCLQRILYTKPLINLLGQLLTLFEFGANFM